MKNLRILVPTMMGLLALTTANGVHAETTINPSDNGNLSVTGMIPGNGCTVLFSPQGRMIEKGSSCSSKEINKAQKAIDSYVREQNASADDEHRPKRGDFADGEAGGPDFWEISGVANNNLGLKAQPSLDSGFTIQGLRNGTILRNLGCGNHNGDRWCRVEVQDNPGKKGWARMQYLRESGGSSRSSSPRDSFADGDAGGPDFWEISGVANNNLGLKAQPSLDSSFTVEGLRNGTILRNLGCKNHNGDRWCRVEVQKNPSQKGWVRMQYLRESR
jgi:hypothetical protein